MDQVQGGPAQQLPFYMARDPAKFRMHIAEPALLEDSTAIQDAVAAVLKFVVSLFFRSIVPYETLYGQARLLLSRTTDQRSCLHRVDVAEFHLTSQNKKIDQTQEQLLKDPDTFFSQVAVKYPLGLIRKEKGTTYIDRTPISVGADKSLQFSAPLSQFPINI